MVVAKEGAITINNAKGALVTVSDSISANIEFVNKYMVSDEVRNLLSKGSYDVTIDFSGGVYHTWKRINVK